MKRIIKFTTLLSLQILLLGAIGFAGTYFSEYLADNKMFGDEIVTTQERSYKLDSNNENSYEYVDHESTSYGARHIWYIITIVILFMIQVLRIVLLSTVFWDKGLRLRVEEE